MLDLIIIGGGPAGAAAGVYAARKQLKTVLVTAEVGGQSSVSEGIENWIGTLRIGGNALAMSLKAHLEAYKGSFLELIEGEHVNALTKVDGGFEITTASGKRYSARAVLVASGAGRRKLAIPGADKFENKGVTYCASCDGPLFAGADVAVVGGGNAGFETAAQLLAYAKSVTLLARTDFKADEITVEAVTKHPNMTALRGVEPTEVVGDKFVSALKYKDMNTGEEKELAVSGVFAEIGVLPNTDFVKGVVALDAINRITVDARNQRTSVEGIWAAGDVTDELYHQNNIAAGDGVKALEDIYLWLKMRS
jgi:alkyl hydroperoxide reductase subunit AhpF